MFTIRRAQLAALASERAASLYLRIADYLTQQLPPKAAKMGRKKVEEHAFLSIKRARSYGLVVEWDLCRFCLFAFHHGLDFDREEAWAKDILANKSLTPKEQIAELEAYHLNQLV